MSAMGQCGRETRPSGALRGAHGAGTGRPKWTWASVRVEPRFQFAPLAFSKLKQAALAAGVSETLWSLEDVVAKIDELAGPP